MPEFQDPEVDGEDAAAGLRISKVPFKELISVFPDVTHVSDEISKSLFKHGTNSCNPQ